MTFPAPHSKPHKSRARRPGLRARPTVLEAVPWPPGRFSAANRMPRSRPAGRIRGMKLRSRGPVGRDATPLYRMRRLTEAPGIYSPWRVGPDGRLYREHLGSGKRIEASGSDPEVLAAHDVKLLQQGKPLAYPLTGCRGCAQYVPGGDQCWFLIDPAEFATEDESMSMDATDSGITTSDSFDNCRDDVRRWREGLPAGRYPTIDGSCPHRQVADLELLLGHGVVERQGGTP